MKYFLNGTNQKLRRTNLFSPRSFHFARISHSGFSLTELLITVTVLGILAAVSVPVYLNHLEKARISEAILFPSSSPRFSSSSRDVSNGNMINKSTS